jgi:hypothetical protein
MRENKHFRHTPGHSLSFDPAGIDRGYTSREELVELIRCTAEALEWIGVEP